jgi:hypothetical protein
MSEPIERELTDHERATLRMAIDTMSIGGEQTRVRGSPSDTLEVETRLSTRLRERRQMRPLIVRLAAT